MIQGFGPVCVGKAAPACYNGVVDILQQLERAIDGCCPCGAEPREGSAYCSEDCTPTHRSVHTTNETAMRWRPDMVTEVDDSDLTLIAEVPRSRRLSAQLYARAGTLDVHLRLHDGHRFVGLDVPAGQAGDNSVTPAGRPELEPFWQRLERQLTDSRNLAPDPWDAHSGDPWADLAGHHTRRPTLDDGTRRRICDWLLANNVDPNAVPLDAPIDIRDGRITVPVWDQRDGHSYLDPSGEVAVRQVTVPLIEPWPPGLRYQHLRVHLSAQEIAEGFSAAAEAVRRFGEVFRASAAAFAELRVNQREPVQPTHPLERVRAQRQGNSHGPASPRRPPRQLNIGRR